MTRSDFLEKSLDTLAEEFRNLKWDYPDMGLSSRREPILYWPGDVRDDIMICVLKDQDFREDLHRHDFFFFNYAYRFDYEAETETRGHVTLIREGECYIGQPFTGYALRQKAGDPAVIIGVLVKKQMFYRDFLPVVASDPSIFRFFLDPRYDFYSEDHIHFAFPEASPVRDLLETMVMEYAHRREDTQTVLAPLVSVLLLHVARGIRDLRPQSASSSLSERLLRYIGEHTDRVTLSELAEAFSYHPNYISSLFRKETGRSFSEIVLQMRMERAAMLLSGTELSVEEIAAMLGYADRSNFYKVFRAYYGKTPREFVRSTLVKP